MAEVIEKNNPEQDLLDSWHPHIENAMKQLHTKFLTDTKFILTESDLKCWLFYYMQHVKPYTPYAVHTEVTHYAEHQKNDKEPEKKYKFRDLSLLCPWLIKESEEIWKQENPEYALTKGFKHKGPAIHFELKLVRQLNSKNQVEGLKSDIEKLKGYHPNCDVPIRNFVIVCGSRSENTTVEHFKKAVEDKVGVNPKAIIKVRVRFYLFDKKKMVSLKYVDNEFKDLLNDN